MADDLLWIVVSCVIFLEHKVGVVGEVVTYSITCIAESLEAHVLCFLEFGLSFPNFFSNPFHFRIEIDDFSEYTDDCLFYI